MIRIIVIIRLETLPNDGGMKNWITITNDPLYTVGKYKSNLWHDGSIL